MARLRDPNRTAKNDGFGHTPYPSLSQQFLGRETVTYVSNIYKYYVTYRLITDQQDRRKAAKAGGWEAQVNAALARRAMSRDVPA